MPSLFMPEALNENGYPAWVNALADWGEGIVRYVVRGLDLAAALERLAYSSATPRTVELPPAAPQDPYSSRVDQALGVTAPEEVAAHDLAELPTGLRDAAVAAGIYDRVEPDAWHPSENFLAVCSLARLWQLTPADLCGKPLLGSSMDQPML